MKNSLLFFLWIWKSKPMPWNIVTCRLLATVKNASPPKSPTMHLIDKHLDPVSQATPKWRISAFTYKPSSSLMGPYLGCKRQKKSQNISPTEQRKFSCPGRESNTVPGFILPTSWWLDALKNNWENYPKKCFLTKEKETRVKRWSAFEQLRPVENLLLQ